jgi:hypothetical protein
MFHRISNRLHQAFRVNRLCCLPAVEESRFPVTGRCYLNLVGPRLVGVLIHDFFLPRHESFRGNTSASIRVDKSWRPGLPRSLAKRRTVWVAPNPESQWRVPLSLRAHECLGWSARRLTDKSVCDLVKAYAGRLGLKASEFGAHSLRAGFLTSAARRGASVFKMRDVSRHKSMDVLQAYVRDADLFRDHAGAGLL